MSEPAVKLLPMTKTEKTEPGSPRKLSFQIEGEDVLFLDELLARIPGLAKGRTASVIFRAIFRLGVVELAKDPSKVLTVEPPALTVLPPKKR